MLTCALSRRGGAPARLTGCDGDKQRLISALKRDGP